MTSLILAGLLLPYFAPVPDFFLLAVSLVAIYLPTSVIRIPIYGPLRSFLPNYLVGIFVAFDGYRPEKTGSCRISTVCAKRYRN